MAERTRAGMSLARAAGRLAGVPLGALARRRQGKPMHPRGAVFDGMLERGTGPEPAGLAWLDEPGTDRVLVRLSAEQLFRVLLVHHPLRSDSRAKRLTDSAALIALIKQHGGELILHGHDHVHSLLWIKGPTREIPAIGIPSASALPHGRYPGAAYNLFTVESSADGWRCQQTVRGLNEKLQISELKRTQLF